MPSWRYVFIVTATLSIITMVGIYLYTPHQQQQQISQASPWLEYWHICRIPIVIKCAVSSALMSAVFVLFVAIAPALIVHTLHLSLATYIICQACIFAGIVIGAWVNRILLHRYSTTNILRYGRSLSLLCITLIIAHNITLLVLGLFVLAVIYSSQSAIIMRIAGTIDQERQSMILSMFSFIQLAIMTTLIYVANLALGYWQYSLLYVSAIYTVLVIVTALLVTTVIKQNSTIK
jgi:predicted MFS family arabinose efflux permease